MGSVMVLLALERIEIDPEEVRICLGSLILQRKPVSSIRTLGYGEIFYGRGNQAVDFDGRSIGMLNRFLDSLNQTELRVGGTGQTHPDEEVFGEKTSAQPGHGSGQPVRSMSGLV